MTEIIIDHRERSSGIRKELAKHDVETKVAALDIADYIIQTKDLNNNIVNVAIERKTQNDFLNSVIDKRILRQLIQMKEHYPVQLLIIEGNKNLYSLRNFHPNSIRGMLASIAIDFQTPILYTRSLKDTAALLAIISKRLEKERKYLSLLKKRKPLTLKEQQEYLIEGLPGIGPNLSKSLLKEFKNVKNIMNADELDLQKVEKIGPKKAKLIKKVLEEYYQP